MTTVKTSANPTQGTGKAVQVYQSTIEANSELQSLERTTTPGMSRTESDIADLPLRKDVLAKSNKVSVTHPADQRRRRQTGALAPSRYVQNEQGCLKEVHLEQRSTRVTPQGGGRKHEKHENDTQEKRNRNLGERVMRRSYKSTVYDCTKGYDGEGPRVLSPPGIEPDPSKPLLGDTVCHKCNEKGHMKNKCPLMTKKGHRKSDSPSSGPVTTAPYPSPKTMEPPLSGVECFTCHEIGHYKGSCPNREDIEGAKEYTKHVCHEACVHGEQCVIVGHLHYVGPKTGAGRRMAEQNAAKKGAASSSVEKPRRYKKCSATIEACMDASCHFHFTTQKIHPGDLKVVSGPESTPESMATAGRQVAAILAHIDEEEKLLLAAGVEFDEWFENPETIPVVDPPPSKLLKKPKKTTTKPSVPMKPVPAIELVPLKAEKKQPKVVIVNDVLPTHGGDGACSSVSAMKKDPSVDEQMKFLAKEMGYGLPAPVPVILVKKSMMSTAPAQGLEMVNWKATLKPLVLPPAETAIMVGDIVIGYSPSIASAVASSVEPNAPPAEQVRQTPQGCNPFSIEEKGSEPDGGGYSPWSLRGDFESQAWAQAFGVPYPLVEESCDFTDSSSESGGLLDEPVVIHIHTPALTPPPLLPGEGEKVFGWKALEQLAALPDAGWVPPPPTTPPPPKVLPSPPQVDEETKVDLKACTGNMRMVELYTEGGKTKVKTAIRHRLGAWMHLGELRQAHRVNQACGETVPEIMQTRSKNAVTFRSVFAARRQGTVSAGLFGVKVDPYVETPETVAREEEDITYFAEYYTHSHSALVYSELVDQMLSHPTFKKRLFSFLELDAQGKPVLRKTTPMTVAHYVSEHRIQKDVVVDPQIEMNSIQHIVNQLFVRGLRAHSMLPLGAAVGVGAVKSGKTTVSFPQRGPMTAKSPPGFRSGSAQ